MTVFFSKTSNPATEIPESIIIKAKKMILTINEYL